MRELQVLPDKILGGIGIDREGARVHVQISSWCFRIPRRMKRPAAVGGQHISSC